MRPDQLILRCLAERSGDQWQAFCLDLNLAAQADSAKEVKAKLEAMVSSYLYDALVGEDREHAVDLLARKAPAEIWFKFYLLRARSKVRKFLTRKSMPVNRMFTYRKTMPLHVNFCG